MVGGDLVWTDWYGCSLPVVDPDLRERNATERDEYIFISAAADRSLERYFSSE